MWMYQWGFSGFFHMLRMGFLSFRLLLLDFLHAFLKFLLSFRRCKSALALDMTLCAALLYIAVHVHQSHAAYFGKYTLGIFFKLNPGPLCG